MNIIETVQKNLGFNALKKIDPNTQDTPGDGNAFGNDAIAQAGIPAILLGIYNRMELEPFWMAEEQESNLLDKIFGKSKEKILENIADYSRIPDQHSEQQLEHIASESLRVIKNAIGDGAGEMAIRKFVSENKPDALLYLPPSLELGKLFENNNLDDRTGKMEGPISSLMHKVEKSFNTSSSI